MKSVLLGIATGAARLRTRGLSTKVLIGVIALVGAACSDDLPTAPSRQLGQVELAANQLLVTREIRSTGTATGSSMPQKWQVRMSAEALPTAEQILRSAPSIVAGGTARLRSTGAEALPVLRMTALSATQLCQDDRPWRQRLTLDADNGIVVESEGRGDRPAELTRVLVRGAVFTETRTEWVRRRSSWDVVRQETTRPGTTYKDELVVTGGDDVALARDLGTVSRVPCGVGATTETSASVLSVEGASSPVLSRPAEPRRPTNLTDRLRAGGTALPLEASLYSDCDDGFGDPDPCKREREREIDKLGLLLAASTALTAACAIPQPVQPLTCAMAGAAYAYAVYAYGDAVRSHQECKLRNPPKPPCSCQPAEVRTSSEVGSGAVTASDLHTMSSIEVVYPGGGCGDGGSGGGGGGGGGGMSYECRDELWEISFDGGATWHPIVLTFCEWEHQD